MEHKIDAFIQQLAAYTSVGVFNPWRDFDAKYDKCEEAPAIRRENLKQYLWPRLTKCPYMIIAEAIGYQGGRYTGIAMTCERMILGYHKHVGAEHIFPANYIPMHREMLRTSDAKSTFIDKRTQRELGFNEPTDTVVWGAILENNLDPFSFLLWNIFPFHPHKENPMSNRTPTDQELQLGWHFTQKLLDLNGECQILAVGQKAANTLKQFGIKAQVLRHPANGGASIYRHTFAAIMNDK